MIALHAALSQTGKQVSGSQRSRSLWPGDRAAEPCQGYTELCGKMRVAHFATQLSISGGRRRREDVSQSESRISKDDFEYFRSCIWVPLPSISRARLCWSQGDR